MDMLEPELDVASVTSRLTAAAYLLAAQPKLAALIACTIADRAELLEAVTRFLASRTC